MIEFNINNYCYVQLTDAGRKELKQQHDELNKHFNGMLGDYKPAQEDNDGWSKWQMHSVMNLARYQETEMPYYSILILIFLAFAVFAGVRHWHYRDYLRRKPKIDEAQRRVKRKSEH